MKLIEFLRGNARNLASAVELLKAIVSGLDNATRVVHEKLQAVIAGMDNQSRLLDERLQVIPSLEALGRLEHVISELTREVRLNSSQAALFDARSAEIIFGISNHATLLNDRAKEILAGMDNLSRLLNENFASINQHASLIASRSSEIAAGVDSQARLTTDKSRELVIGMNNLSNLLNEKLGAIGEHASVMVSRSADVASGIGNQTRVINDVAREVIVGMNNLSQLVNDKLTSVIGQQAEQNRAASEISGRLTSQTLNGALPKPTHSSFEAKTTLPASQRSRQISAQLYNAEQPSQNAALAKLMYLQSGNRIAHEACTQILASTLEEVKSMPNADRAIRALVAEQQSGNQEQVDGGLFVFWLVRRLKPRDVVQTAGIGGPSPLLTILALARNGGAGQLHLIEAATIEPDEAPQSLWKVPTAYQDRAQMHKGDTKTLLSKMVDQLEAIDMFVQGSSCAHERSISELEEARRKLSPGAVIVATGAAGVEVIRNFAAQHNVPALDFNSSLAVAFF